MQALSLFPEPDPPPPGALAVDLSFAGQRVRLVGTAERPEWVATDVARVLALAHVASSMRAFDDDEKGVHTAHTPGGAQQLATVTEPGLYRLVMRSRKPDARTFRRWIFHDVLPTIRRHGCYPAPQAAGLTPDTLTAWAHRTLPTLAAGVTPTTALMHLSRVPSIAWLPAPVSEATVYEWHRFGRRGIYLETLRHAGRLYTSEASVFLFLCRLAHPNPRRDAPVTLTITAIQPEESAR